MKDFAESRTTYYSLAREKLKGKHPRILSVLILLLLISMAGFAAFLLSDILSFGLNSDHRTFLAGLEHQDSIDNILSIINWNEKSIKPAAVENPVAQRRRFDNPPGSNTSPGSGAIVRMVANKSGDGNSSPSRAVYIGQNAKEQNYSNSSRTASNQPLSGSTFVSTGDTSSSKLVNEKKAPVIKMNHGSSSGTPTSQPLKQKPQANATKVNTTQANTTHLNTTKADAAQVSNIQTNNSSTKPLQEEAISSTRSPVYSFSLSQSQADPTSVEASPIGQSQSNAAEIDSSQMNPSLSLPIPSESKAGERPLIEQSVKEKTDNGNDLSEEENKNTASGSSPANPVTTLTDSTKDTPAEKPPRVIEFKTDSTTSPGSENTPSDGNTNSGTVSNAVAPSSPMISESSPVAENKDLQHNVSPSSTDSTSNSKSPAIGGGSASLKKPDTTGAGKAQKLQEIRHQKTANQNRLVESAKKRAARSRG
jgi:hypothetical protein